MPEIILGIESSCDESSAALVRDGRHLLAEVTARQEEVHQRWGGIVPELASRKHTESLLPVVKLALEQAGLEYSDVTAIAVTNRPGLIGSLMVGVSAAKALAYALEKPLIPVNHLEAHLAAVLLDPAVELRFPALGLIISGGHTSLYEVNEGFTGLKMLGHTRDDAAGEAFDKAARLLGLPYPGGPEVARLAEAGDPCAIDFPRALPQKAILDFSFSGLKTSITRYLAENPGARKEDICASFQEAIADALVGKTALAAKQFGYRDVIVAGGVAANKRIRAKMLGALQGLASTLGVRLHVPAPRFCTDNGAMIAAMGSLLHRAGIGLTGAELLALSPSPRTETKGEAIAAGHAARALSSKASKPSQVPGGGAARARAKDARR